MVKRHPREPDFPEFLRLLMAGRQWEQEELATQLHVNQATVSRWLGARSFPDTDNIVRIAEVTGEPVETVISMIKRTTRRESEAQRLRRELEELRSQLLHSDPDPGGG